MDNILQRTILLLEDDLQLSNTIKQFLTHYDYIVIQAFDGVEAQDIFYENQIDIMLLDVKVPQMSGFEFLEEIRKKGNKVPAIFITSLNSVIDVEKGFNIGCDDYIRKPFTLKELLVRVESLIKKNFSSYKDIISLGDNLTFNIKESILYENNIKLALKNKEAKLLELFLKYPNERLSYERIFDELWDYNEEPSVGSLRAYITKLRSYIGKDKIETIKNIGYKFVQ